MFHGSFKAVSKMFKKVSRVFQECFNEVLFCNFVLVWISSQLPEQKEGLFLLRGGKASEDPPPHSGMVEQERIYRALLICACQSTHLLQFVSY